MCQVRRRSCCPQSALINSLEYSARKMKDTLVSQRTFEFIVPISLHYQADLDKGTPKVQSESKHHGSRRRT